MEVSLGGWSRSCLCPRSGPLKRIAGRLLTGRIFPPGFAKGGDRKSLTLHAKDEDLLLAVAAANPRTIAVLVCGSAVIMERWREAVPAIVVLWYAGMEGGNALADILLGKKKPTGRLPFAIPTSADHLPPFDNKAKTVSYSPLHGQALLDHLGVQAAFPFGFGLTTSRVATHDSAGVRPRRLPAASVRHGGLPARQRRTACRCRCPGGSEAGRRAPGTGTLA